MTYLAQESLRPAPSAPSNTARSRFRSDGSTLPLTHPRLLAQLLLGWLVDEVRSSSFQTEKGWNCFDGQLGALMPWLVIRVSLILRIRCNKM